jgi:plastocyanin
MIVRLASAISLAVLVTGCGRGGVLPADQPLTPIVPSALNAPTQAREAVLVNMLDACDPETFNAKLISCARGGGVTFDQFIAHLTRFGLIGPWRFAPAVANVRVGQSIVAANIGGEVHTFTRVADFGGGIVPLLNDLAHVPRVAPECTLEALEPEDFVAPGGTYRQTVDRAGALKFQCCIHPWMRLDASSRDSNEPDSR